MSVNRSAKLGYGFMVHDDELEWMEERGMALYDSFVESDYAVRLDGYANPSPYFFGLTIFSLDEGEAAAIPNVRSYDRQKYAEMVKQFKQFCPNRTTYLPKDYILFCID